MAGQEGTCSFCDEELEAQRGSPGLRLGLEHLGDPELVLSHFPSAANQQVGPGSLEPSGRGPKAVVSSMLCLMKLVQKGFWSVCPLLPLP